MKQLCPVTCKVCYKTEHIFTKQKLVTELVKSKHKYKTKITKTTTITTAQCVDLRKDCYRLNISFGWCKRQAKIMKSVCPKTCDMCHVRNTTPPSTILTSAKTRTTNVIQTTPIESYVHTTKSKEYYTSVPTTVSTISKQKSAPPRTNRAKTLSSSTKSKVKVTEVIETCKDLRGDCYRLGVMFNWCKKKQRIMQYYCSLTCKFCQSLNTKSTLLSSTKTLTKPSITTKLSLLQATIVIRNKTGLLSKSEAMTETSPQPTITTVTAAKNTKTKKTSTITSTTTLATSNAKPTTKPTTETTIPSTTTTTKASATTQTTTTTTLKTPTSTTQPPLTTTSTSATKPTTTPSPLTTARTTLSTTTSQPGKNKHKTFKFDHKA